MSIDSAALTEFNWGEDRVIDYITDNNLTDCISGSIHSHHSMGVTPSQTDWDDVTNQTVSFRDGYLFMIVNNKLEFTCIYGMNGQIDNKISYKNIKGKTVTEIEKEDVTFSTMCNIDILDLPAVEAKYVDVLADVRAIVAARPVPQTTTRGYNNSGVVKYTPKDTTYQNNNVSIDVKETYELLIGNDKVYNEFKMNPECFCTVYEALNGEVETDQHRINLIKRLIAYVKTLKQTGLTQKLIKDYNKWITLETDTKAHYGQTKENAFTYWD